MATAAAAKAPVEEAAPPAKKSGKKGLILILVALIMAGGGAGGAWWYVSHQNKDGGKAAEKKEEASGPPQYVNIDQFVVNLNGNDVAHYLQTSIVLAVKDNATSDELKQYMPLIRNKILLLLSSQNADDLTKPEAKTKLAADILQITRDAMPGPKSTDAKESKDGKDAPADDKGVKDVLFSAFIIQ